MADSQNIHAIGRRKEAVCRVYLRAGSGKWNVNGRTLGDYFPRPALVSAIQQPFTATDTLGAAATATETVTVVDNTPPEITAPPSITRGSFRVVCSSASRSRERSRSSPRCS